MSEATGLISNRLESKYDGVEAVWSSIGASKEVKLFEQRAKALSDPKGYSEERNKAINTLKNNTAAIFKTAFDAYEAAGYGPVERDREALKAAKMAYNSGMAAIRASFPGSVDRVYEVSNTLPSVARAMRSTTRRRAAPKKRKAPAKRR
jgi:hypothetical protein